MQFHCCNRLRSRSRRRTHIRLLVAASLFLIPIDAAASSSEAEAEVERLRRELASTQQELTDTRSELDSTKSVLGALVERVSALESETATAPGTAATPIVAVAPAPGAATARLAPVNADNPAISFVVDTTLATDTHGSWESIGYPDGWDFALQSGELYISAPIDPFLRGYTAIVGSSDEGFGIEEAALVTTALPWNFTVKGGRFFADVGRLSHWHIEQLPFVDRPPSLERIVGGESGAEGVEISWLTPLDQFVELTGGVYNAVGNEYLEEINEDGFFGRRSFDELTFLARAHGYVDLTEDVNLELGGTWYGVPQHDQRNVFGVDATLRHQPGTSGFYQGLVWGTEWLWNDQQFTERDDDGEVIGRMRDHRQGGYSYVEAFFGRRWSAGARFDYSEAPEGDADIAKTASIFATWKPSEFQRLRFQVDNTWGHQSTNQRFTLQWTAFLGSHHHGFAQR